MTKKMKDLRVCFCRGVGVGEGWSEMLRRMLKMCKKI